MRWNMIPLCRNLLFPVPLPKSSHCFLCIFSENRHSLSTQIYTWICGPLRFLLSGSLPSTLYYTWVFWFNVYETVFHTCSYEGHRWSPCVQIQGHLSVVPLRHQPMALSPRQASCTRLPGLVLSWVFPPISSALLLSPPLLPDLWILSCPWPCPRTFLCLHLHPRWSHPGFIPPLYWQRLILCL